MIMPPKKRRRTVPKHPGKRSIYLDSNFAELPDNPEDLKKGHVQRIFVKNEKSRAKSMRILMEHYSCKSIQREFDAHMWKMKKMTDSTSWRVMKRFKATCSEAFILHFSDDNEEDLNTLKAQTQAHTSKDDDVPGPTGSADGTSSREQPPKSGPSPLEVVFRTHQMNAIYESSKFKITALKEGYCRETKPSGDGVSRFHADGSITLVRTERHKILVDTGGPWDRQFLIEAFEEIGLGLDDILYVIGTHGHSDHIGNLNLFPDATQIVGWDVCRTDLYSSHPFSEGKPYVIEPDLVVMPTPGHTHHDVSLVVHDEGKTIVIAGDLFESENDLTKPSLWRDCSEDPVTQEINRDKILNMADIIVPGHGAAFHVKESYRTKPIIKCEPR